MNISKKLLLFVIALIFFSFFTMSCYADTFASVTIEGRYSIEGNVSETGNRCFALTPVRDAPMPEGTADGIKKADASNDGNISFGEICYNSPGLYEYIVSRTISPADNIVTDDSVFKVMIEIFSDGTHAVFYEREGSSGKTESIEYIDRYQPKDNAKNISKGFNKRSVKTGDASHIYIYCLIFISALVILIICLFLFGNKKVD